jgi:hypothetical protein
MDKITVQRGFVSALGVTAYTALVGGLMFNAEHFFGNKPDTVLAPISVLTMLVLSVGIVGCLIFLKPIIMYLDGKKVEAVKLVVATLAWLAGFTVVLLGVQIFF